MKLVSEYRALKEVCLIPCQIFIHILCNCANSGVLKYSSGISCHGYGEITIVHGGDFVVGM